MSQLSNFDYIYAVLGLIIGLVMIFSPHAFMRYAKYNEESIKTESLLKKIGIILITLSSTLVAYLYFK